MPIPGIEQPEILPVDGALRLRQFDGAYAFALDWYQDAETVWLVDGVKEPYTPEKLQRMYEYLNAHGELYFIEALEKGQWTPIGDVCFWPEDMPIVIGDRAYRGRGVGRRVIAALVRRGRALGCSTLYVNEIYDYNPASRRCFESAGFRLFEKTERGGRYKLELRSDAT